LQPVDDAPAEDVAEEDATDDNEDAGDDVRAVIYSLSALLIRCFKTLIMARAD
jgi:hypothetical protein